MSGEIIVPETPNWLQELEAKREKRLKAKLGHEAGAGAPCLKCGEKCPGLDLHFWRKCCKICKCAKEEHEVQDDDIYGWAQFQLLGSKPNKIKKKILLPGKKDEIDLDWAPKGNKETVDRYLKTLPPEQLPVKGSQAAQDRKQLLQKQIPIHDIDPSLCHELTDDELNKMNEYIAQIKQSSAGVGQIISLSSIIKGNLHTLNPSEAAVIANRYAKGIPVSEIIKLQSHSMAGALKKGLSENMERLNLNNKTLPNFTPNILNQSENTLDPLVSNRIHDKNYSSYSNESTVPLPNSQFANVLGRDNFRGNNSSINNQSAPDPIIQNSNFDHKNQPSHFLPPAVPYSLPGQGLNFDKNTVSSGNSAFVPYQKSTNILKPGQSYVTDVEPMYANSLLDQRGNVLNRIQTGDQSIENVNNLDQNYSKAIPPRYNSQDSHPIHKGIDQFGNYVGPHDDYLDVYKPQRNIAGIQEIEDGFTNNNSSLIKNPNQMKGSRDGNERIPQNEDYGGYISGENHDGRQLNNVVFGAEENINNLRNSAQNLPNYAPGKYSTYSDTQTPLDVPKNFRDLAFTTYDPSNKNKNELEGFGSGFKFGQYRQPGSYSESYSNSPSKGESTKNPTGFRPIQQVGLKHTDDSNSSNPYLPQQEIGNQQGLRKFGPRSSDVNTPLNQNQNSNGNEFGGNTRNCLNITDENSQNAPYVGDSTKPFDNYNAYDAQALNSQNKPSKTLSVMHPASLNIGEDFVHPSQVNVGPIQDISYPEIKAATHGTNDFYEDYSPDSVKEIFNNLKLPDCHHCKKPFEEKEFAVTIERANVLFHADCFKCAGCNQILADNVYFYHKDSDNIYCLRDYAKIRGIPRCKACDELIFTKEYCLAENATFHLKHFCCIECDKPLAGQDYTLEDGMPYCLPCFEQSKANKCSSCFKVIKPDEVGANLNGVHFHVGDECFACKVCKKPLMGKKLLLRNEKLYCSHECYGIDK